MQQARLELGQLAQLAVLDQPDLGWGRLVRQDQLGLAQPDQPVPQGCPGQRDQLGLVVGATYPQEIERVRSIAPTLPLLIPGVGAQGGDAVATVRAGLRSDGPIIVNSSRAVLYASSGDDFGAAARAEALRTRAVLEAARSA